ncbi:hypothetical protein [Streptomyces chilikensis]|uniref:Uncharacterized protein n=1 Tax=Streptomyces chilikensis TaxID=1194079 RepID=A0ABV3EN83_9ACTN|nr:hypothetical protein [Streptomyces chilikensis]
MWNERSTTRDREPVLLRDVLAEATAALREASGTAEAAPPAQRCGECGAENRRSRAVPGRRTRAGAEAACPYRRAA